MRQPQVAPLLGLLLALVLAVPVAHAFGRLFLAGAFLVEFLGDGGPTPLSRLTATPRRSALPLAGVLADRHVRPSLVVRPLVLVPGFAPEGKNDARAVRAATLLARAGFDVAVPTVPGLTTGRLRGQDVERVVATVVGMADGGGRAVTVIGVSVGAGPALLAAADPRARDLVSTVLSLGGYASARELVRFFLTGDYAYGAVRGHVEHDARVVRAFVDANADLVDEPTRAALARGERATAVLAAPPADLARLLDALSPLRVARSIRARLVLVHGRDDRAIPFTESLRLADARPEHTRLILIGFGDHVDLSRPVAPWRAWHDLLALWIVVYGLLVGD